MRLLIACLALSVLAACGRGVPPGAQVVVAGDSVMAWNRVEGGSVADRLAQELGIAVGDVSLPYAQVMGRAGALNIASQVRGLDAPWVVLDGGANDLGIGCSQTGSADVLDRLIAPDGLSGAIPEMVGGLTAGGGRVLWADYYISPRFVGTACAEVYALLETRLERMAAADPNVVLVDMEDVMPATDRSLFARDRIHPSQAGSARIATLIAQRLKAEDPDLR